VVDLLQLSSHGGPALHEHGVELDVDALERGADTGGATADDDDVVDWIGNLTQVGSCPS
jgi:hypothetical protein